MRKLVPLLVVLVLVAACGGNDESVDTTSTTSRSAITTTAPSTVVSLSTTAPTTSAETQSVTPVDDATPEVEETSETPTTDPVQVTQIDAEATLRAVGPVRIGMEVGEASTAAGVTLRRDLGRQSTDTCHYVTPGAAMRGVSIMVVDDQIARIEIDAPSEIATRSGVRIGTTAANLRSVYPDNIQQANNATLEGEAMAFVPNDDFDSDYRIYFEIENGQVARYRLGVKPAIDYLRGCQGE